MDKEDFAQALTAAAGERARTGIGTLREKSVHAVLKAAYEPHPENHEIPVGGSIADIVGEAGIIEIQTRDLWRLKAKLTAFLAVCDVTVVYPVSAIEWISRTDPETGEVTRRKSSKRGKAADVLPELYALRSFLQNPHFHIRVAVLETERYDLGRARGRKTHLDRVPTALTEEVVLECPDHYRRFLPECLPPEFTAEEFGKAVRLPLEKARMALGTLNTLHLTALCGKRGRRNLYQIL